MKTPNHLLTYAVGATLLLAGCAYTGSQDAASDRDSRFVKTTGASGYYLLSSSSTMRDTLGIGDAPVSATSDQLHAGRGGDVIAFFLTKDGVISKPPAYIYQTEPDHYYTERLAWLYVGKSTLADVKNLFSGGTFLPEHGGTLVYLIFRVRNPAERPS